MKKVSLLATILVCVSMMCYSQQKPINKPAKKTSPSASKINYKIAYINVDYIFDKLQSVKTLEAQMKAKSDSAQNIFNAYALDYQTKLIDYQNATKNIDSLTTEKINLKLKQVQESKTKAEEFQKNTEKTNQQFVAQAIQKINQDIESATEKIAAAQGYPYVFRRNKEGLSVNNGNVVLYAANAKDNLSDAVIAAINGPLTK
ncbi:MAG: OmpH family outer membrane protein [Leadbetterella sp.]